MIVFSWKAAKGGLQYYNDVNKLIPVLGANVEIVNPVPALKREALEPFGFTAFISVINHGAFCGAG